MPAYSVTSTSAQATASTLPPQSLRQQGESASVNRLSASSSNNDRDGDDTGVQATQRVQAAQPTVNTRGQTIGSTINTTA